MWIQPTFVVLTTGNDNASGIDAANAIATTDELARRLTSGTFNQNVTVTFGPGSFGDLELELDTNGFLLTILGNVTDDAPQPLVVVTPENPASKTRGAIEVAAGTFNLDQRIKVTSGAALGAFAYITKVLGPIDFNVDRFRKYNADASGLSGSGLVLVNPAVGDTIVAQTLNTQLQCCKIEVSGGGRIAPTDFRIATSPLNNASHHCESDFTDAINGVFFKGCQFSGPGFFSFIGENMGFAICKFAGGVPIFEGAYMSFLGCYAAGANLSFGFNSFATFESSFCAVRTGGGILVNQGAHVQFNNDDCTFWDGVGGTALEVRFGSFCTCRGGAQVWGSGTYANSITVQSGCWFTYFAAKPPAILGGTKDFIVGGQSGFYSSLPFSNPANNAGIGLATV